MMTTRMMSSVALVVCCFLQLSQAKDTCQMRVVTPFFENGQQDKTGEDCRAGDKNGRWTAEGCKVTYCMQEEYWTGSYTCLDEELGVDGKYECRKKEIECCTRGEEAASPVAIAGLVLACVALFSVAWISVILCMIKTPTSDDDDGVDGIPMTYEEGPASPSQRATGKGRRPSQDLQYMFEAAKQQGHVVDVANRPNSVYTH